MGRMQSYKIGSDENLFSCNSKRGIDDLLVPLVVDAKADVAIPMKYDRL